MRMVTKQRVAAVCLCLLVGLVPLSAESTEAAREWLERLAAIPEAGPYRVSYTADMSMVQMGQGVEMQLEGQVTQADASRFRMSLTMSMRMEAMPEPMKMDVVGVADGEQLWMETNNPMLGGRQVIKMSLDKMKEVMAEGGQGFGLGGGMGLDPMSQVEQMARLFDLEVAGIADGVVTLRATLTEETREQLGESLQGFDMTQLSEFTMLLEESTGILKELRMGSEKPLMTMRFLDFERLETVDASTFAYAVPEGVQVMDLDALGQ